MTHGTCGAIGEKVEVILVWVNAPNVENASHPQELGDMNIKPYIMVFGF